MGRSEIQYSLHLVPQRSRGGGFTDRGGSGAVHFFFI